MGKVLITGGAGFLGSHLCDRFLKEGRQVVALDNLCTGSRDNISHLKGSSNFQFIEQDLCDGLDVSGIDLIYNMACPASPVHYYRLPIETLRVNSEGMLNVLELAKREGARVVQSSTSEVYGDPLEHPQREEYWGNVNSIGPRSCYDEGKRYAEALCMSYHRTHGVDVRLARIFNTYGPRMALDDGRVVSEIIARVLRGEPALIYGTGKQTRSFCYVDDMVDALYRLGASPGLGGQIVNLGNPAEFSILQMVDMIFTILGSNTGHRFEPAMQDDPRQRRPDISKAKKLLDWEPSMSLDRGLARTIEYFKSKVQSSHR